MKYSHIGIVCVLVGLGSLLWPLNKPESAQAVEAIHDVVRSHLACPTTAHFPGDDEDRIEKVDKEPRVSWKLNSYVDAENVFGATVRRNYFILIQEPKPNEDEWTTIWMDINGKIVPTESMKRALEQIEKKQ